MLAVVLLVTATTPLGTSAGEPVVAAPRVAGLTDAALVELAAFEVGDDSGLSEAMALAAHAVALQMEMAGIGLVPPPPMAGFERPSEAFMALAAWHAVELDAETRTALADLDQDRGGVAPALAAMVDAHLVLEAAARAAPIGTPDEPAWKGHVSILAAARGQLLDRMREFSEAVADQEHITASDCTPVQAPPAFTIDLTECDNVYVDHFAFSVDVGGTDTYHNNAGGNSNEEGGCVTDLVGEAASLLDLGTGADRYGDPEAVWSCGINGGAHDGGAGVLVDEAGDDAYLASTLGVNGGGFGGSFGKQKPTLGFLLDGAGNDIYASFKNGANGGGSQAGIGFLFDAGGEDHYVADELAVNGGGSSGGLGLLIDGGGDDYYHAHGGSANGGAELGIGALVDLGGTDLYYDDAIPGGECTDCTVLPKGEAGAQIDR